MIEKPKRPKKIPNQDNKQPQTIQELIRRYDLDNKDIYKFLDYLVENINNKPNTGEGSVSGDTLPVGSVIEWDSDIIPENWLLLNGQAVSRTTYSELFALYGTRYGAGDGSTTFNLPNRKTRVSVGKDSSDSDFDTLGKTGGSKTSELRALIGSYDDNSSRIAHVAADPIPGQENYTAIGIEATHHYTGGITFTHSTRVKKADGTNPDSLQPYFVTNFIVKAKQSAGLVATIVDNLSSASATDALSAKQGKVLNEKIDKNSSYSTDEQVIGKWIDGKKIYRKTLAIDAIGTQAQQVWDLTNLNIDTFFVNHNRSNYTTSTPNNYVFPLANNFKDSDQYRVDVLYVKNNKSLYVRTNDLVEIAGGYITIEYTKITD